MPCDETGSTPQQLAAPNDGAPSCQRTEAGAQNRAAAAAGAAPAVSPGEGAGPSEAAARGSDVADVGTLPPPVMTGDPEGCGQQSFKSPWPVEAEEEAALLLVREMEVSSDENFCSVSDLLMMRLGASHDAAFTDAFSISV